MAAAFEAPPSYSEATRQHASLVGGITFVDFRSEKLPGLFRKFEKFDVLVAKANAWLRSCPQWEVKTCESVENPYFEKRKQFERMSYFVDTSTGKNKPSHNSFLRYLRLWLVPRSDPLRPPQQIGYANLVPRCTDPGGVFEKATYQPVDEAVKQFNASLRHTPIPGRILTVETQEMVADRPHKFNPDKSFYSESRTASRFLTILRVFYEIGVPSSEEFGFYDFIPQEINIPGSKTMHFESFSTIVQRASAWCASNTSVRFCNAQTVRIKVKKDIPFSTTRSFNLHSRRTPVMTILRVVFTVEQKQDLCNPSPQLCLTCKTFEPVLLREYPPKYETLSQTKLRIEAWINATRARVLSAETVAISLPVKSYALLPEITFNKELKYYSDYHALIISLYFDGQYQEPPPEVLPKLPEKLESNQCCII